MFTGGWTSRQIAAWIVLLMGLGGSIAGLVLIHGSISQRALILLIGGVAVLCGGLVYLLATEDRGTGLVTTERREESSSR